MNDRYVIQKMSDYMHQATGMLSDWLNKLLPKVSSDWWNECVLEKISYAQREMAKTKGFSVLDDFDLAALLRIADKNWYAMRDHAYLPTKEREVIRSMQGVRNNWAHCGGILPGKDMVLRDINVLTEFFEQMSAPAALLADIRSFRNEVENPGVLEEYIPDSHPDPVPDLAQSTAEITDKSVVRIVGDPDSTGIVMGITKVGDMQQYSVFVNGSFRTFFPGQIELVDNTPKYNWVDIETFQSYLSAYQINNPSAANLYSLNSARIDFVPYQFRPALKMIKADEPRILIADSVGVGKTIEAGLIIKELQARNPIENIMIICPKPLVSERKWEIEMKRFDEEFIPLNGADLRQIISDTDRDGEWPVRYDKTIVPYSILDSRVYDGEDGKGIGLEELDPAPHFDLVIVDEAHHIRNGSMDKEKAYAYKCVKYFCDHADAVVMLTATPLQTGDDDLFTLLNVLRPDVVLDKATFSIMSKPNSFISQASSIVRAAGDDWQHKAMEQLARIMTTQWGENVISKNPLYGDVLRRLMQPEISREDRVQLITDIESLHSFNTMMNRTRRKDIQDFCIRRAHTLETSFTPHQQELHDELLAFERAALSQLRDVRAVPFMMSTIRRQAASCIFGLAPFMRDIINRRFQQMADDPDIDLDHESIYNKAANALAGPAQRILELADNLPEDDPKFDSVLEVIQNKLGQDNNKVMIFSTFRHTLAYIKRKLRALNIRVEQVDGSVKDEDRRLLRERFSASKEEPTAIDVLLFTEVGSEGLDYQFCDMMINYDLPWNPMRIEQRIGRIDRRGQKSEVVNIYNVITTDTVDADIYERCLLRIGVFEQSIGECEEILHEIGTQVERIAVNTELTAEERRRKLEQIADNKVRKLQEMTRLEEEEKALFGFDLSGYTTSKEIQDAESPWLTQGSLQALVQRYLTARLGIGTYILGEGAVKTLRLNSDARKLIREDFNKLPQSRSLVRKLWDVFLKGRVPMHPITFDSEAAEQNENAFFITAVHPLVKQAARYFASSETAYISLRYLSAELPAGDYPFSVYAWNYVGINPHFKLIPICAEDAIMRELNDIFYAAQTMENNGQTRSDLWKKVEERHLELWQQERQEHLRNAQIIANYKRQSIENNYRNRRRLLEQKIRDAMDMTGNILRIYQGELESAQTKYQKDCDAIREGTERADLHITLIANGIIHIEEV